MELLTNPIIGSIVMLVILIYSAILHEIAHGYVADRLGDPTARLLGRLTLDPRPHIDPWMSIALPLILFISGSPIIFGGAKPVPVDDFNLRDGDRDMALVALSGPLTNALIAIVAAMLYHLLTFSVGNTLSEPIIIVEYLLRLIVNINVLLAIFNLVPIPPLDGSKIFALLLPPHVARTYLSIGNLGPILLFFILLSSGFQMILRAMVVFALSLIGF
jgi:Zn-dependent protease